MSPRVVSLLPSATELLCAVGGGPLLVGRSHECDYPPSITSLPVLTSQRVHAATSAEIDAQVREALGSTDGSASSSLYTLDAQLLRSLKPDVILTQDLCEVCSIDLNTVRSLAGDMTPEPTIVSLNPAGIDDLFDDMLRVGEAIGRESQAREAMTALRERFWQAQEYVNAYVEGPQIAFLEWIDPIFVGGHWTPELIHRAGGRHSLNEPGARSRQVTADELLASHPDRVIICPCGYDMDAIQRELPALFQTKWWHTLMQRDVMAVMVDGNQMFNRPGPRLVDALWWLVGWINDRPEIIPQGFPAAAVLP